LVRLSILYGVVLRRVDHSGKSDKPEVRKRIESYWARAGLERDRLGKDYEGIVT
jgi:hypothetical protein